MRKLPQFTYFRPESFSAALALLNAHAGKIRPLAGGTDLFIAMKEKGAAWDNIMDLKTLPDADFIRTGPDGVEIGALATIRAVETSALIRRTFPLLAAAAGTVGSVQVRNRATIGGNLCNAAPSADTAPALLCLGARGEIIDAAGTRQVPLEEFFLGPGKTVLGDAALLKKIIVPLPPANSAGIYYKESPRRAMDLAVAGVACFLTLEEGKKRCVACRIALGAVAPTPMRARNAEALLAGREITANEIAAAAETAAGEASPISDVRGSAEFRREMVKVYVRKGLDQACREARG